MKRFLLFLFMIIGLLQLVGCTKGPAVEDILHIDIYHNDRLVTSMDDQASLINYHNQLLLQPAVDKSINSDLIYTLEMRTFDSLLTYQLIFDLKKQEALAISQSGTYEIPFTWVDEYLGILPIPETFGQYMPPTLILDIDGYTMAYGYAQNWFLHPTTDTAYLIEAGQSHSENYTSNRTSIDIEGSFDYKQPDVLSLDIVGIDVATTYDNVDLSALPVPEEEGPYRYELTARWTNEDNGYSGTIVYSFGVSIEFPETYGLNKNSFQPGDCMAVIIRNPKSLDYKVETTTYDKTIGLFYLKEDLVGLIPLSSRITPGEYEVKISVDSTDTLLETIAYTVLPKEFERQQLSVASSTAALKSDDNYAKDAAKFGDAKKFSVGEKLWEGTFLQPVIGRISTEYSMIRYINGGQESSRHSGLDIAAPTGTPVLAANKGIVTFASDLIVSGNVIVLDHGYGLFTSYVHLDDIYVVDGQEVNKGDTIGAVGSTGYSTGPHLHWTVWKNGVYLNPWKFIEEDPLAVFEN